VARRTAVMNKEEVMEEERQKQTGNWGEYSVTD
jgi:hypothetical protein